MIGVDTHVLVHYLVKAQPEHAQVRAWFESVEQPLGTTAINIGEVLRLLTHRRVFPRPMKLTPAIDLMNRLISYRRVEVLEESERWLADLSALAKELPSLRGNDVFDARIALCLRYHGIEQICTLDSDFSKYRFLTLVVPQVHDKR